MSETNFNQNAQGQPYGGPAAEHPQGTLILILGILGIFTGITAFFAWYLGSKAMKEIKATGVKYSNEQSIVIGKVLGMILSLLTIVGVVIGVIAAVVTILALSSTG